jgi:hypothetical protein
MDTVTPPTNPKEVLHMGLVGYLLAAGMVLILLPLLPLLLVLKLLDMARKGGRDQSD